MKNKHEQLYVAVQDLLIGLDITPEKLRSLAMKDQICTIYQGTITTKTAQKLIDADLIVEEINWRKSGKLIVSDKNNEVSEIDVSLLNPRSPNREETVFDKIKSGLAPGILWSYLREKHPEFLLDAIKDHLFSSK